MCARRRQPQRGTNGELETSRTTQGASAALRDTALALSRAPASTEDRDRERANLLWQELVTARCSLIDRFESDGRSYLIARWNEQPTSISLIDTLDRLILAQRAGGLSLKVIASELGLSISAVGRRLRTCMARLGLSNLAELASLFGGRSR